MLNIYAPLLLHICVNTACARICAQVYRRTKDSQIPAAVPPPHPQTQSASSVVTPLLIGNLPATLTCYWLVYCVTSVRYRSDLSKAASSTFNSIHFNSLSNLAQAASFNPPTTPPPPPTPALRCNVTSDAFESPTKRPALQESNKAILIM